MIQAVVRVDRDPERLYRLTAGWEERRKAAHDNVIIPQAIPKRGVPNWRQGL